MEVDWGLMAPVRSGHQVQIPHPGKQTQETFAIWAQRIIPRVCLAVRKALGSTPSSEKSKIK